MSIRIYGSSDDLIEVEGDLVEEFSAYDEPDGGHLIACSDGTLLRVTYGVGGVWRITPIAHGSTELAIMQAPEDDDDNYSDVATLTGEVLWVARAAEYVQKKG